MTGIKLGRDRRRPHQYRSIPTIIDAQLLAHGDNADWTVPLDPKERKLSSSALSSALSVLRNQLTYLRGVITPQGYNERKQRLLSAMQSIQFQLAELEDARVNGASLARDLNDCYDKLMYRLTSIWEYDKLEVELAERKRRGESVETARKAATKAQEQDQQRRLAAQKLAAAMGITYGKALAILTI